MKLLNILLEDLRSLNGACKMDKWKTLGDKAN